jgi:hypothetical protein
VVQTRDVYPLWQQGLTDALRAIDAMAGRVVLLAETPFINYDPVDCLADPKVSGCDPPRSAVVDAEYAAVEAAAADAAGADILSINDLLCPGTTCPVQVDGAVVFRDSHHVTATYMASLSEPIGNLLEGRPAYPSPSPSPILGADAAASLGAGAGAVPSADPGDVPGADPGDVPSASPPG